MPSRSLSEPPALTNVFLYDQQLQNSESVIDTYSVHTQEGDVVNHVQTPRQQIWLLIKSTKDIIIIMIMLHSSQ